MAGHSKWSKVKRQKEVEDARRSTHFTKLSRAIAVAARRGNDPNQNIPLRLAVERARAASMPSETITRAIQRGSGELKGQAIEELLFEGFGPGGAALLVSAVTDNKNRTTADVRALLEKYGGSLAGAGSVRWMFVERGIIEVPRERWPSPRDQLELALIDAGAEEIETSGDPIMIVTSPERTQPVLETLRPFQMTGIATIALRPLERRALTPPDADQLRALIVHLEHHDDITAIATNAETKNIHHPRD